MRTPQHIYEVKVDAYVGQVLKVEIED
ncbi:putative membrane protein YkoI [Caldalkalibacillus uzonensis]|uniref:Membrane protein YkoI n=1 Tax=Caldalkalibacillus uzonensis TaxID=353224 RepID=A0ABU0CMV8_9BACI|nr:putative membrane protein YkoI [Caldalkalibacillus uzonensis]